MERFPLNMNTVLFESAVQPKQNACKNASTNTLLNMFEQGDNSENGNSFNRVPLDFILQYMNAGIQ